MKKIFVKSDELFEEFRMEFAKETKISEGQVFFDGSDIRKFLLELVERNKNIK